MAVEGVCDGVLDKVVRFRVGAGDMTSVFVSS